LRLLFSAHGALALGRKGWATSGGEAEAGPFETPFGKLSAGRASRRYEKRKAKSKKQKAKSKKQKADPSSHPNARTFFRRGASRPGGARRGPRSFARTGDAGELPRDDN